MKKMMIAGVALCGVAFAQSSWTTEVKIVTLEANKVVSIGGKF